MAISSATRQKMLTRLGKIVEALVHLSSEYPEPFRERFMKLPEEALPYPRRLIAELLEAEIAEPEVGAAIRGLSVEGWRDTLRALDMQLAFEFLPRDRWLAEMARLDPAMDQAERWLVERDEDSLFARSDGSEGARP